MSVNSWLNYHHLYYFRSIANEGGIAKASRLLRLGQPTLSTQLKQFEDALGHQLFSRETRKLELTEAGRVALEYANEIFRLGAEMQEALADRLPRGRVELQVGALDTVPKHLLLRLVQAAKAQESCVVSVLEGRGEDLFKEVRAHRLDLVVANHPPGPAEAEGLRARSIGRVPVTVVGSKAFAGLAKSFPRSLEGQPFVMPTSHSRVRHDVEHCLKSLGVRVEVTCETQDTALQKLLAIDGVGLIPISEAAVETYLADRTLFAIGRLPDVFEELWLISGDRRIENPVAAGLMKSFLVGAR